MEKLKRLAERFNKLSKKKKTYIITVVVLVFIMAWAFISASVITGNFNRAQIKNGVDNQKVNAIGVIITETKSGTKYFELYGEKGNYNNKDGIAILHNVIGNFYKENDVSMSFQSSKGSYDEKTETIVLYENTYIVMKNGTSLEADKLTWQGSDKDTIAEGHIKIKKGNEMTATAEKCIIGAGYDKFKIIGKTETKIYGKDKEK